MRKNPKGTKVIWHSMAAECEPDLRWVVENQAEIRKHPDYHRKTELPILVYPSGSVRLEFIGTFESATAVREHFERFLPYPNNTQKKP